MMGFREIREIKDEKKEEHNEYLLIKPENELTKNEIKDEIAMIFQELR